MTSNESSTLLRQALGGPAPATLQEALKLYELVYMPSRNFAARTRINYSNDLTDLIDFVEGCGRRRLSDISQSDLEAYLADLDRRDYAGTSRKRKTYAIKSLFRFLHDSGYLAEDVSRRLIPPKTEQKEPRVLTRRE
jgi:site-specific recombinase XerD